MSRELDRSRRLLDATLATIAYADIFDFAMEQSELHRDLVFVDSDATETNAALTQAIESGLVVRQRGYLTFPERRDLAVVRRQRQRRASVLWPVARAYGQLFASIPFVRMVGVTGSLAADNPPDDADIDYILVSIPGRLWLVRAAAIAVVRLAKQRGSSLCPNYLLTTRALLLARRDLYTAHEALQVRPIFGHEVYRDLIAQNEWLGSYLPNRVGASTVFAPLAPERSVARAVGEFVLGGRLGTALNQWEERRKIDRFRLVHNSAEFSPDACEGHFHRHRERILARLEIKCADLGVDLRSLAITNPQWEHAPARVCDGPLVQRSTRSPVVDIRGEHVTSAGQRVP